MAVGSNRSMGVDAGLMAALKGIQFVVMTPALWPWALMPAVLLILLTCGLGGIGWWGAGHATVGLAGAPEGLAGQVGAWLLYLALVLAGLLVALLLALALAQPLSGFALEKIVLAQQRQLTGQAIAEVSLWTATLVSASAAFVTLTVSVGVLVPLFFVDFFFPPATLVTIPLRFLLGGWLLAWNFIDYPLSLRGHGLRYRLSWSSRHFAAFTSFGLFWSLLLVVPGLYLLVLPFGVAGATHLVVAASPE
jgi:CysZ protein